jgi:hypothetical protein
VRNIADVTKAVASGDLSKKMHRRRESEILSSKTRSTRWSTNSRRSHPKCDAAVATRSRHRSDAGGQANVRGVAGTWKDLTDSVNFMPEIDEPGARNRQGRDGRCERRPEAKLTVDAKARSRRSRHDQ